MLIVSKFRDYYDSVVAWGIDKQCVFKRESFSLSHSSMRNFCNEDGVEVFVLFFCGKSYPCVKILGESNLFFYSENSLIDYLLSKNNEFIKKRYESNYYFNIRSRHSIKNFFNKNYDFNKISVEHKCPYFVFSYNYETRCDEIIFNPVLKNLGFVKVVDPATCFQEIHMFMSGVIGSVENDIIEILDIDKIKQRGFDKYSFRKGKKK